jgi:hypothetical protein
VAATEARRDCEVENGAAEHRSLSHATTAEAGVTDGEKVFFYALAFTGFCWILCVLGFLT